MTTISKLGYAAAAACGAAVTDPLGQFRASSVRITGAQVASTCHAGSVDFPAGRLQLGSKQRTGGMVAYPAGHNHYVGNTAFCAAHGPACPNLAVDENWEGITSVPTTSWTVEDRPDYQFALGVKSYGPCTGREVGLTLWFGWEP